MFVLSTVNLFRRVVDRRRPTMPDLVRAPSDRDIDLVLVTGAGASHEFGINGTTVPLMGAWSNALVDKLSQASWAYLEATGLDKNLDGPEFEKRLGSFLRLADALPRIEQVLKPSLEFQAPPPNMFEQSLRDWHRTTLVHIGKIVELIRESLFENFSYERMNLEAAQNEYANLLQALLINDTHSLVYATTNYDILGEYAIQQLGRLPDWGEQRHIRRSGEPLLGVERLLDGMPRYTPVLHLHGRVGWYRRDGKTVSGDTVAHNSDFGVPIVMLPDPEKEYNIDPVIFSLWSQFEVALQRARRVLVLGHSLNDRALVEALQQNVSPPERLAVSVLGNQAQPDQVDPGASALLELLRTELPSASIIPIRFKPTTIYMGNGLEEWKQRVADSTGKPVT